MSVFYLPLQELLQQEIPVLFFNGEYFLQRIGIYEAGFSFKPENIVPIE
jgi:hypothetical protein